MKMSITRRAKVLVASSIVAVICAVGAPQIASADDEVLHLTTEEVQQFMDNAAYWGVDQETAATLLDKYVHGIRLDSMTGAPAVSVKKSEVNGFNRTVKTYADGSIIGTEVEIPKPAPTSGVTPMAGYLGCSYGTSAGVSYGQDCYVYNSGLTVGASYYTSFSRWSGGSSVWNWHTPTYNVIGGTISKVGWNQPNGHAIQLRFNINTLGYPTSTAWLQFDASNLKATSGGTW